MLADVQKKRVNSGKVVRYDICDRLGRIEYSIKIVPSDLRNLSFTNKSGVYSPIKIREDNPECPYDDYVPSDKVVPKKLQEKAYNPEGPVGVEGHNPPVYSEMSNIIGAVIITQLEEK